MKTLLTIIALVPAFCAFSQDIVFDHPMELSRSLKEQRGCYPVVDAKTGNIHLILYNHKSINVLTVGGDFSFKGERMDDRPADTREILGHALTGNQLCIFFNTSASSKITRLKLNLETSEKEIDRLEIGGDKEKYITSFSVDDNFVVMQALRNSNELILYTYSAKQELSRVTHDFSGQKFSLEEGDALETILRQWRPEFIESKIPNPLEITSAKTKVFQSDSSLILTLDNEKYRTAVVSLPFDGTKGAVKFFNHGFIDCGESVLYSSNSYLHQNFLYQFKVCQNAMGVTISSVASGDVIKKYTVQREGEIDFKNTDIIQEGSETNADARRELSKTKQFLRKCSYSNAAISVYPQRDEIVMVVGSFKEITRGGPGIPMYSPGTQISTPGGTITTPGSYNPVYTGYGAYKFSKAVYFKSKLKNSTFDHSPGLVFDDAFKKIKNYSEVHIQEKNYMSAGDISSVPLIAETLFKRNERYYLGYYDKENKRYVLREFR
ncbi:MAG TPA: hypothetical protein VGD65_14330 [Chryseosolibacter sp.]